MVVMPLGLLRLSVPLVSCLAWATVTLGQELVVEAPVDTCLLQSMLEVGEHTRSASMLAATPRPGNLTMRTMSEKLYGRPMNTRIQLFLCGSFLCLSVGILVWVTLLYRHVVKGRQLSGVRALPQRTVSLLEFLGTIPFFAITGGLGLLLPELSPIWRFQETLLLSYNFQRVPALFASICGGTVRTQQLIEASHEKLAPVRLYGYPPCCCFMPCLPPRVPQLSDMVRLRLLIFQLCVIQPLLAFLEMVFELESVIGLRLAFHAQNILAAGWVTAMKVISCTSCMSACRGLAQLVQDMNEDAALAFNFSSKLAYCQSYLLLLNLIPNLARFLPVWQSNGHHDTEAIFTPEEQALITENLAICLGMPLCVILAWFAFPADDAHYPELAAKDADGLESVFVPLQRCPGCGSAELVAEDACLEEKTVTCTKCGLRGLSAVMAARRPRPSS